MPSRRQSFFSNLVLLAAGVALTSAGFFPVVGQECVDCHDDKNEGKVVHAAVRDFGCDSCHTGDAEEHDIGLVADEITELCLACHDDPTDGMDFPHEALEMGSCIDCHDPHTSNQPRLLLEPVNALCTACHEDQGVDLNLPVGHAPLTVDGCTACHMPHGGHAPALLRAPANALCEACHVPTAGATSAPEAVFAGHELPGQLLEQAPRVPLSAEGRDHPVLKHPVGGGDDPRREGRPFGCTSCHRPHGSSHRKLLVAASSWVLCIQCHR
ncbi:MAG: cytochrome c3 family protein [Acidobacteriota bacterium]|nr:cytochrome c3 family protein [Acidobacteriota bacterium]MDQ7086334.1 cytochrome c3 family protein [Acidobacteriota bacterium]